MVKQTLNSGLHPSTEYLQEALGGIQPLRINPFERKTADPGFYNKAENFDKLGFADSFVCPTALLTGRVKLGEKVLVAPYAKINESVIGFGSNVQDGVKVNNGFVGTNVSLAHQSVVEGGVVLDGSFLGMRSTVEGIVGENCIIAPGSKIPRDVKIPDGRFVPPGTVVETQEQANELGRVEGCPLEGINNGVLKVNQDLAVGYRRGVNWRIQNGIWLADNPKVDWNPKQGGIKPEINNSKIGENSVIIGAVKITDSSIGSNSVVRGDEGCPIIITNSKTGDELLAHGLETEEHGQPVTKNLVRLHGEQPCSVSITNCTLGKNNHSHGPAGLYRVTSGFNVFFFRTRLNDRTIESNMGVIGGEKFRMRR